MISKTMICTDLMKFEANYVKSHHHIIFEALTI